MAQIVIFAPEGEDVSSGEQALKDAGHDVEVVEATAENLLHMAIGMVEGKPAEEPEEEPAAEEDPLAEPAPDEESVDEPEETDPKKMESMSSCTVGDEKVGTKKGKKTRLYVSKMTKEGVGSVVKRTFALNESTISTWENSIEFYSEGEVVGSAPLRVSSFQQTYLEVGPELHHLF